MVSTRFDPIIHILFSTETIQDRRGEGEQRSAARGISLSLEVASGSRARQKRNTNFTKSAAAHNHP